MLTSAPCYGRCMDYMNDSYCWHCYGYGTRTHVIDYMTRIK